MLILSRWKRPIIIIDPLLDFYYFENNLHSEQFQ